MSARTRSVVFTLVQCIGIILLAGCALIFGSSPNAVISADVVAGSAPLSIHFDGSLSYDVDGGIRSYTWDFGDGGSATGLRSVHTYLSAGAFQARLVVVDTSGKRGESVLHIQVLAQETIHGDAEGTLVIESGSSSTSVAAVDDQGMPVTNLECEVTTQADETIAVVRDIGNLFVPRMIWVDDSLSSTASQRAQTDRGSSVVTLLRWEDLSGADLELAYSDALPSAVVATYMEAGYQNMAGPFKADELEDAIGELLHDSRTALQQKVRVLALSLKAGSDALLVGSTAVLDCHLVERSSSSMSAIPWYLQLGYSLGEELELWASSTEDSGIGDLIIRPVALLASSGRPIARLSDLKVVMTEFESVRLDGTASHACDSQGNGMSKPLRYSWRVKSGENSWLEERQDQRYADFVPMSDGTYQVALRVHDGFLASDEAIVEITANPVPDDEYYNLSWLPAEDGGWYAPVELDSDEYLETDVEWNFNAAIYPARWGGPHLGLDLHADRGEEVRAIADGVVVYISPTNDPRNEVMIVVHGSQGSDATQFAAVYGHVTEDESFYVPGDGRVNVPVDNGDVLGTINGYGSPDHIHLGVNTDIDWLLGFLPNPVGWGVGSGAEDLEAGGWVEPYRFFASSTAATGSPDLDWLTDLPLVAPVPREPGEPEEPGTEEDSDEEILLEWEAVDSADAYWVYVSRKPYGEENLKITERVASSEPSYEIPAGELDSGTNYRWNVCAERDGTRGPTSERLYFHTKFRVLATISDPAVDAPTEVLATAESDSAIRVTWDGSTSLYAVMRDGTEVSTIDSHEFLDGEREASTTYCYAVQAIDSTGRRSSESEQACATTFPNAADSGIVPPTVETLSVTGLTDVSAVLRGRLLSNGGEPPIAHGFEWGETTACAEGSLTLTGTVADPFSASSSGLIEDSIYFYRAWARNSESTGYGQVRSFRTETGADEEPEPVTFDRLTMDVPPEVFRDTEYDLVCEAVLTDGTRFDVTTDVTWEIFPHQVEATISHDGRLTIGEVLDSTADCAIRASYDYDGVTKTTVEQLRVRYVGEEHTLVGLEIRGPSKAFENEEVDYSCIASFADGKSDNVHWAANWSVSGSYVDIDDHGALQVEALTSEVTTTIRAAYTHDGVTFSDSFTVSLVPLADSMIGLTVHMEETTWEYTPAVGAVVAGHDGNGNEFDEKTDSDGYAYVIGAAGTWDYSVTPREEYYTSFDMREPYYESTRRNFALGRRSGYPAACFDHAPESPASGESIQFTDCSVHNGSRWYSDVDIVEWKWSFGDGQSSSVRNPQHSYPVHGSFEVTLTVTDEYGGVDKTSSDIIVAPNE